MSATVQASGVAAATVPGVGTQTDNDSIGPVSGSSAVINVGASVGTIGTDRMDNSAIASTQISSDLQPILQSISTCDLAGMCNITAFVNPSGTLTGGANSSVTSEVVKISGDQSCTTARITIEFSFAGLWQNFQVYQSPLQNGFPVIGGAPSLNGAPLGSLQFQGMRVLWRSWNESTGMWEDQEIGSITDETAELELPPFEVCDGDEVTVQSLSTFSIVVDGSAPAQDSATCQMTMSMKCELD